MLDKIKDFFSENPAKKVAILVAVIVGIVFIYKKLKK